MTESLDHYRNRISLAKAMGMEDYATDMSELLARVEIAEDFERVVKASRDAITDTYQRLSMQVAVKTTDDAAQRDAALLEAGARMVIVAGNMAAEKVMAEL